MDLRHTHQSDKNMYAIKLSQIVHSYAIQYDKGLTLIRRLSTDNFEVTSRINLNFKI